MKNVIIIILLFTILLPLTTLGQRDWYERQARKQAKMLFSYCEQGKYQKYEGKIMVEQTKSYLFYEVDSIRIYISHHFSMGFLTYNDTCSKKIYQQTNSQYGQFFSKGFITGDMFICELNDSCKYYPEKGGVIQKGDSLIPYTPELFFFFCPTIKILNIKHLKHFDTRMRRRFEIWATSSKKEDGWGAFPVFFLELTNYEARRKSSLTDFLNGAKISCFRYGYTQI